MFTATLLSEPYAYPLVLAALLVAVTTVAEPTRARVAALVTIGVGLIFVGGFQLAFFLPACIGAYILCAPTRRVGSRRLAVTAGCVAVAGSVVFALRHNPHVALWIIAARPLHAHPGGMLGWLGINAFVLAIAAGWVIVPGALLGLRALLSSSDQARAFVVLSLLITAGCLVEAAAWSARGQGLYERFAIYPVPLLAIGFVAWLESAGTRRLAYSALAYGLAIAAVLVPLASGLHVSADNSPTITGLARLGPGAGSVVWAPLLAVLAAALALIGPARRSAVVATAVCISTTIAATTAYAFIDFSSHRPAPRVHTEAGAAYLTNAQDDPVYMMRSLFWNPAIDRVLVTGSGDAPDGFPATNVRLEPAGRLVSIAGRAVPGPYVVGPATLALGRSGVLARGARLASFEEPPDVIAFGWYRAGGDLAPFVTLVLAGGRHGLRLELALSSRRGTKRLALGCGDAALRTLTVGATETRFAIRAPPRQIRSCQLRLIQGSVDVVNGHDTSVHGTVLMVARTGAATVAVGAKP